MVLRAECVRRKRMKLTKMAKVTPGIAMISALSMPANSQGVQPGNCLPEIFTNMKASVSF